MSSAYPNYEEMYENEQFLRDQKELEEINEDWLAILFGDDIVNRMSKP